MKAAPASLRPQRGHALVEFGFVGLYFFIALFMLVEVTRAVYVWSMLSSVTRMVARAAIVTIPTEAALKPAKVKAIVAGLDDKSTVFGTDITIDTIRVKYLGFDLNEVPVPASGNANITACKANPQGASCARFVQVQMCQAGTDCDRLEYIPFVPFLTTITVPTFVTILPVQSLGCAEPCT